MVRDALPADRAVPRRPRHRCHRRAVRSPSPSIWARPAEACGRPRTPATRGRTFRDGFFAVASMGAVEVSLIESRRCVGGHGIVEDPQQRVDRPRHLQIDRRRQDVDASWACATWARSRPFACIPRIPTSCMWPRRAIRSSRTRSAAFIAPRTAARRGSSVLHLSDTAGAADLELQPGHPEVVFACMWHAQRKPWTIISGAKEGGIYKSTDGGENWTKLAGGLPHDLFGRANVAISMPQPNRIYALIEAKPGSGLYRSEDAGATWSLVNATRADLSRGRSITTRWAWTRIMPTWCGSATKAGSRAPMAGKRSAVAGSARRQSRCLDQSEEFALHDSESNDGGATFRWMAGAAGARRRISRRRRFIRSRWTISIPIWFTARSRITLR